jgi:hypothetical protein
VEHDGPHVGLYPKPDGRQRPLGITALEDKIVWSGVRSSIAAGLVASGI